MPRTPLVVAEYFGESSYRTDDDDHFTERWRQNEVNSDAQL